MKNTETTRPFESSEIGTPRDYTDNLYRVYFELPDPDGLAGKIIADFVGPERACAILRLAHGYETELPIQCIPEIVRLLALQNLSVYQVVRYAKSGGVWV